MGIEITDVNNLAAKLESLSSVRFDAVILKNMTQIYNRGKQNSKVYGVGTPVASGELRISLGQRGDVVGYTKSYAPHVEYGHRTTTGGYVQGQRYLKKNVDTQRPIFKEDLINQLRGFG